MKLEELQQLLNEEALKEVNLIIGPIDGANLALVENHCAMYHIPLVVPLKYYGKSTIANFPLFNMFPSDTTVYQTLGKRVKSAYPNYHAVMVGTGNHKLDYLPLKHFSEGYGQTLPVYQANEVSNIEDKDTVVVFIPIEDEAKVRLCLNGLKKRTNVKVVGLKEWLDFKVIDYPMWNNLNLHYGSKFYLDYKDSTITELRKEYRESFKGEPSEYFYIAYDQMMFFGEALYAFGENFPKYIKNTRFEYIHNSFQLDEKKGYYENSSINLIQFVDFSLDLITE